MSIKFKNIFNAEMLLALALVGTVSALILPVNRAIIDVLTVFSLSACLTILLVSLRIQSPTQLLTFPALLLITTLLRLVLNVASTKMILTSGHAGYVIEAFGKAVMGSNILVGLSVFAIVSVVQFLVVAKGSDRVAEVSARFSLDAMPGKQMSIDAEMRAGTITAAEASAMRSQLDTESRFFGGMDGAMKFVKGDAIAGLIIAIVNIVAGVASGMLYHSMSAGDALQRYAVLSIGDAMVAQVPSLMIALAAGLVITRVSGAKSKDINLGEQIIQDLKVHPSVMYLVGGFCWGAALIKGVPAVPFVVIGLLFFLAAAFGPWRAKRAARQDRVNAPAFTRPMPSFQSPGVQTVPVFIEERAPRVIPVLMVKLSEAALREINPAVLDDKMQETRARLADQWGYPFPGLKLVRDEAFVGGTERCLTVYVQGAEFASLVWPNVQVGLNLGAFRPWDDGSLGLPGWPDAAWEPVGSSPLSSMEDIICALVLSTCLREPARLLTHEEFRGVIKQLNDDAPALCQALSEVAPLTALTEVARNLLREGMSLKYFNNYADMLVAAAPLPQDAATIGEMVIRGSSRARCSEAVRGGVLSLHLVDKSVENLVTPTQSEGTNPDDYLSDTFEPYGPPVDVLSHMESLSVNSMLQEDALRTIRKVFTDFATSNPAGLLYLVCKHECRLAIAELASMASGRYRVFSLQGVNPRVEVKIVSIITLSPLGDKKLPE